MTKRRWLGVLTVAVSVFTAVGLLHAWWLKGHEGIAEAAVSNLPEEVPAFFRAGAKQLAHCAGDPDRWKNPACKQLRDTIGPDHYIDLEDFGDKELPKTRYEAVALLYELKHKPEKTGMLPWAIMEGFDKLSCAFYDYRHDSDDPAIRAKCLVYAGNLCHFTGDCSMPLHTTIHYDGRIEAEGKKTQRGIHAKIDAFPEKFGITSEEMARGLKPQNIEDVWEYVLKNVRESHTHIERCYALDKAGAFDKPTDESRKFILERCRAGAQFTMDLWYTAWLRSEKMPKHYSRGAFRGARHPEGLAAPVWFTPMPDFIACPKCGCRVQMLIAAPGQRVRCIGCDHRFEIRPPPAQVPAERVPPLEAGPADEPNSPRGNKPTAWPDVAELARRLEIPPSLRPLLEDEWEDLPFCPGCGRRVRWEVLTCRHCGEEFEDDRELRAQRRRATGDYPEHRDVLPHRARTINNLGSISLSLGLMAFCLFGLTALLSIPLGITAWVMANNDLEAMRNGLLDRRGRKQTEQARGNAITAVVFGGLFGGCWLLLWLCLR